MLAQNENPSGRADDFETLAALIDALDRQADQSAVSVLRQDDLQVISRGELRERIHALSRALVATGLQPEEPVVLWAGNSPEWIIACLAVIRAGGRIVPLDLQLDRKTLQGIVEDCRPRFLLTFRERLERLQELECDLPSLLFLDQDETEQDNLWQLTGAADLPALAGDDGAALFYTSGTTGPPKGVPLTHRNLSFQLGRILETDLVLPEDRLLLPLPLHHVYPFVMGMLLPLAAQISIVLPYALTGPQILRAIQEGNVTVICGVPRLYRALEDAISGRVTARGKIPAKVFRGLLGLSRRCREIVGWQIGKLLFFPLHRRVGPQLRLLASGGSALNPELGRRLEGLGWQVAIGYGLTETSPLLTINPPGSGRFESVGRAIPGVELKLDCEADGGEGEGEVLARGPNVFAGYYQLPEKTEEAFAGDWFRTGDLGRFDEEGFLQLRGRVSTLIVTESGKNINPEEVEEAYGQSPCLEELGIVEQDGGLAALAVPTAEGEKAGREAIEQDLERIAEDLPSYWRLNKVLLTERSLPRTRLGKLRRHLLAERFEDAGEGETATAKQEPLSLQEMTGEDRELLGNASARNVWDWLADRYPEQGLSPDSRLQADLGIDSLEWVAVTVEIGERTGVELDEEAIAEIRTVRDLLSKVAAGETEGGREFGGEPLEHPEKALSDRQRRWLEPPGGVLQHLQGVLLALVRRSMRSFFDLQVEGLDRLPEGPCVFAPNHLSSLDPLALAAVLPRETLRRTWWGGWTGIAFRNRMARFGSRLGNVVPVDPDRAAISSLAFGAAVLREERNLVWFPEGKRSPDGELQSFKPGLGLLLEKYPVHVVPILIEGTRQLLPIGKIRPRRGEIRIVIGSSCLPSDLAAEEGNRQEKAKSLVGSLREKIQEMRREKENAKES